MFSIQGEVMKKVLLVLSMFLCLGSHALAAEVDVSQSSIKWKGSKVTGSNHFGKISPKSSSLTLEGGKIVSGRLVLDMRSLTVDDIETEKYAIKFLNHMKGDDFFQVEKYPTATLEIKRVDGNQMSGSLTIKGITKPFSFPTQFKDGKYIGKTTFDRTKFGVIYKSGNFFQDLGDKVINDEVEISFEIALKGE